MNNECGVGIIGDIIYMHAKVKSVELFSDYDKKYFKYLSSDELMNNVKFQINLQNGGYIFYISISDMSILLKDKFECQHIAKLILLDDRKLKKLNKLLKNANTIWVSSKIDQMRCHSITLTN